MATQDELNTNDGMYTNNNFSPYYERNTNQNMDTGYNTGSSQSNNQTFVQRPNNQGGTNYNAPLPNARMMKKDDNGFANRLSCFGNYSTCIKRFYRYSSWNPGNCFWCICLS